MFARLGVASAVCGLALAAGCREENVTVNPASPAITVQSPTPTAGGGVNTALLGTNLVDFHAKVLSTDTDDACRTCHGDMSNQKAGTAAKPAFHARHLAIYSSVLSWKCTTCHAPVDLLEKSGGGLRKQVDVTICVSCHKPNGIGALAGYEFYKQ